MSPADELDTARKTGICPMRTAADREAVKAAFRAAHADRREVPRPGAETALSARDEAILASFAAQLAAADDLQFEHLAQRAEGSYATDLGARERQLVNSARDRRAVGAR